MAGDDDRSSAPNGAEPGWLGAGRTASLRGAALVAAAMLALATYRGMLDGATLAVALAAVLASLLLPTTRLALGAGRVARTGEQSPPSPDPLLSKIPDPVILVDHRSVVRDFNEAARAALPLLKLGQPLSLALRAPEVLDEIGRALRTGEPQIAEYRRLLPVEQIFEVAVGFARAPDTSRGTEPEILLFFRDLTAARRLERMRVDFVANASHELRTPLASLLGFIETLQGPAREDPAARERFLGIMLRQALRMSRLIDDLLSLSRIERKAHLPPRTPVDLLTIVRQVIDGMGPLAREAGVGIALHCADEPYWILGERDELIRAVENLIDNALKYGQGGAKLDVSLTKRPAAGGRPAEIELVVRDYGPGIAPEHLPRLTERFYRADVAESRQKGGTGLGLAIVKHIVVRHKGRLGIDSEVGRGASFAVTFPQARRPDDAVT